MKTGEVIAQLCRKTGRALQEIGQKQTFSTGKRLFSCSRHWPKTPERSIRGEEKVQEKDDGEDFL
jgi:hypothetical protein